MNNQEIPACQVYGEGRTFYIKNVIKKKYLNDLNKLDTKWSTKSRIYKFYIPAEENCIYSFIKINVNELR